jgi:hypothetical protein
MVRMIDRSRTGGNPIAHVDIPNYQNASRVCRSDGKRRPPIRTARGRG